MPAGKKETYLLSSVNHSLQVLELLTVRDGLRLKDISDELGLDRSSAFKLLYTLSYRDFVFKDEHARYHLGSKLAPCRRLSESRHRIAEIAWPYILQLWAKTGKTVLLGAIGADERPVILSIKIESGQESIIGRIGASMELHTTGLGKVLLAYMPPEMQKELAGRCPFVRKTEHTITDPELYLADMETFRKQKWAAAFEENHPNHCDLAVPVFEYTGTCVAGLCIVSDRESMDLFFPLYRKQLQSAAAAISEQLGSDSYALPTP